ncbi:hypothetical protein D8S78_03910 [Natrialba swarupiae]|nr:hypothetical protein [Natrialba swarupiae]
MINCFSQCVADTRSRVLFEYFVTFVRIFAVIVDINFFTNVLFDVTDAFAATEHCSLLAGCSISDIVDTFADEFFDPALSRLRPFSSPSNSSTVLVSSCSISLFTAFSKSS